MAVVSLKNGIDSVGVLNPTMRVFDIIMKTEYGTSYNAYLVRGTQKSALVETVHDDYFEDYLTNIESIMPVTQIDYIILNHTEPDHSGSLAKLLAKNPNITVVGTMAALKYLDNICNVPFQKMQVKNGDVLDLGGKSITFYPAPFLHWPDSMFSYVKEDKVLFSCDFLGAHYCEPRMTDSRLANKKAYEEAFSVYYQAIFGPFKSFVLKGLSILENLDIDMVAPSHGPVLMDGIQKAKENYRVWSQDFAADKTSKKIAIIYVSAYGCTAKMAQVAFDELVQNGWEPTLYDATEYPVAELQKAFCQSHAVMLGSPTINQDALKPIWDVLSGVDPITQRGKKCAVFGSYGWSGEAVGMLKNRLTDLKLRVCGDGCRVVFVPNEEELAAMRAYTKEFAEFLKA